MTEIQILQSNDLVVNDACLLVNKALGVREARFRIIPSVNMLA